MATKVKTLDSKLRSVNDATLQFAYSGMCSIVTLFYFYPSWQNVTRRWMSFCKYRFMKYFGYHCYYRILIFKITLERTKIVCYVNRCNRFISTPSIDRFYRVLLLFISSGICQIIFSWSSKFFFYLTCFISCCYSEFSNTYYGITIWITSLYR